MENIFYLSDLVLVQETGSRGRGVFAAADLPKGLLLETAPVIVMTAAERVLLDQTLLHDYIFIWGEKENQCAMALGYVALYNHAPNSNCEYVMDFAARKISVVTVRKIKKGAELFINYNGDWNDNRPVWFELSDPAAP